nr:hypothetical protein RKYZRHPG_RKYZRHPG_CDS_0006 [uncultured phage]
MRLQLTGQTLQNNVFQRRKFCKHFLFSYYYRLVLYYYFADKGIKYIWHLQIFSVKFR